ncbi:MAG: hypothetical protein DRJ15_11260 [Bacteroidetes bacterium]|nr:MAG: hypothetical protein DRJ15_11260 [Bacteroidota bacterium]
MSILEDKIKKNRQHYDVHEPDEGHIERFASKLDEKLHTSERKHRRPVWRIAATIALVATISALLIFQYSDNSSTVQAGQMSDELSQVVDHYNRLTDQKLGDISNCAASNEEAAKIDEMARVQLEELEKDAGVLQEELIRDDSNDRVYGALVNNYRTRIKILDNIIAKICQL